MFTFSMSKRPIFFSTVCALRTLLVPSRPSGQEATASFPQGCVRAAFRCRTPLEVKAASCRRVRRRAPVPRVRSLRLQPSSRAPPPRLLSRPHPNPRLSCRTGPSSPGPSPAPSSGPGSRSNAQALSLAHAAISAASSARREAGCQCPPNPCSDILHRNPLPAHAPPRPPCSPPSELTGPFCRNSSPCSLASGAQGVPCYQVRGKAQEEAQGSRPLQPSPRRRPARSPT